MKHLKENNETYISHLKFAGSIGLGLIYRSVFFLIHGFLPIVPIPEKLNLSSTHQWLEKSNSYAKSRKE